MSSTFRDLLNRVLPSQASNDYQGHPAALWLAGLIALVGTGRSLVHMFKHDGGAGKHGHHPPTAGAP